MRPIMLFAIVFASLTAISTTQETVAQETKSLLQKLDGKWLVVGGSNQGRKIDGEASKAPQVIFGSNTVVTLDADEKELYKAKFTIDASNRPYHIDMVTDMPNQPEAKAFGIMEFQGEHLRLCYALPGAERPAKFESPEGSKNMLFTLRREETKTTSSPSAAAVDSEGSRVLVTSESLLGSTIMNAKRESIGSVDNLFVSTDGQLVHAVVSVGGVIGIGSEKIAVPLSAFRLMPSEDGKRESWLTTTANLQAAPRLETTEFLELSDRGWLTQNAKFFNVKLDVPKQVTVVDVSQLIDQEVVGTGGESLAYLDELVFDFGDKRQVKPLIAVLGHGGVLGVGKEYVAVAFEKITIRQTQDEELRVLADLDVNRLKELQEVTPNDYPELRLQTVLRRISE